MTDTQALVRTGMTGAGVRSTLLTAISSGDANLVSSLRATYPLIVTAYFAKHPEELGKACSLLTNPSCKDRPTAGFERAATLGQLAERLNEEAAYLRTHELFERSQGEQ